MSESNFQQWEIYKRKDSDYGLRIRSRGNNKILLSSEGYKNLDDVLNCISLIAQRECCGIQCLDGIELKPEQGQAMQKLGFEKIP